MAFNDIAKLRSDLHGKVEELRVLQTKIDEREDKKATDEEVALSESLMTEILNREKEIDRKELLNRHELTTQKKDPPPPEDDHFKRFGDFIISLCEGRTEHMVRKDREGRTMTMGNGPSAGFLVPELFGGMLRPFEAPGALVRPRATYLGGGSDAAISYNAFDQSGSLGVYGGVTVKWICETGTKESAGDLKYRQIRLEPEEVAGYIDVSNKLLRNASEVESYVQTQMSLAIVGSEDQKFVSGSGVGCPLGFIGHAACIEIPRNTASDIKYVDICDMFARAPYSANLVWIANPTCVTRLMQMVDAASQLVWQPSARDSIPGTIIGIPVIFSDLVPTLGTKGDLCLCDFKYYGIRDGSPMSMFADPYSQSVNQITRLYLYWNVDGQPMITTPLLLRDGTSTVSPFVVLN